MIGNVTGTTLDSLGDAVRSYPGQFFHSNIADQASVCPRPDLRSQVFDTFRAAARVHAVLTGKAKLRPAGGDGAGAGDGPRLVDVEFIVRAASPSLPPPSPRGIRLSLLLAAPTQSPGTADPPRNIAPWPQPKGVSRARASRALVPDAYATRHV